MFDQIPAGPGTCLKNKGFEAPVAGVYEFSVDFQMAQSEHKVYLELVHDHSPLVRRLITTDAKCTGSLQWSINVNLNKNNKVWLKIDGNTTDIPVAYNVFSGKLLE